MTYTKTLIHLLLITLFITGLSHITQAQSQYPGLERSSDARNFQSFRTLQIDPSLQSAQTRQSAYQYQNKNTSTSRRTKTRHNTFEPNVFAQNEYVNALQIQQISAKEPSTIESMYAERITEPLEQFGYELFNTAKNNNTKNIQAAKPAFPLNTPPSAAVQDDFVLKSGDELDITFIGQRNDRGRYNINHEGLLIIPDIPPIPAAGRTIMQTRLALETASRNLHNTEVFVRLTP